MALLQLCLPSQNCHQEASNCNYSLQFVLVTSFLVAPVVHPAILRGIRIQRQHASPDGWLTRLAAPSRDSNIKSPTFYILMRPVRVLLFFSQKAHIFLFFPTSLFLLDGKKLLPASTDGQYFFRFCITRALSSRFLLTSGVSRSLTEHRVEEET